MKELVLKAELDSLPQATAFVDEQLEALECSMKAQMQIDIAVDELFANVARYAYPGGEGEVTVRVGYDGADRMASVTFEDGGVPFNPLEQSEPDVSLSAEEREVGGLGIFLVRRTMDRVEYRREDGRNILTIWKRI